MTGSGSEVKQQEGREREKRSHDSHLLFHSYDQKGGFSGDFMAAAATITGAQFWDISQGQDTERKKKQRVFLTLSVPQGPLCWSSDHKKITSCHPFPSVTVDQSGIWPSPSLRWETWEERNNQRLLAMSICPWVLILPPSAHYHFLFRLLWWLLYVSCPGF